MAEIDQASMQANRQDARISGRLRLIKFWLVGTFLVGILVFSAIAALVYFHPATDAARVAITISRDVADSIGSVRSAQPNPMGETSLFTSSNGVRTLMVTMRAVGDRGSKLVCARVEYLSGRWRVVDLQIDTGCVLREEASAGN